MKKKFEFTYEYKGNPKLNRRLAIRNAMAYLYKNSPKKYTLKYEGRNLYLDSKDDFYELNKGGYIHKL